MDDTQTKHLATLTQMIMNGEVLNEDQRALHRHFMALEEGKVFLLPTYSFPITPLNLTSATLKLLLYLSYHLISLLYFSSHFSIPLSDLKLFYISHLISPSRCLL